MSKDSPKGLYDAEQRAHIERELGEGCIDNIESKVHWVIIVDKGDVSVLLPAGMRKHPLRPKRLALEKALEGVNILDSLLWRGVLNDCDSEYWENVGPEDFGQLRRQLEWMLEKKKYRRVGAHPTPQHTKMLVLDLARSWDRQKGSWPTRAHDNVKGKDYGPFLDLVLTVFAPIRPSGSGVADLVRTVVNEGKPTEPVPRLKWP